MNKWLMCVVALILGMLMFHMLKGVCGCKTVEGSSSFTENCKGDGYDTTTCAKCKNFNNKTTDFSLPSCMSVYDRRTCYNCFDILNKIR